MSHRTHALGAFVALMLATAARAVEIYAVHTPGPDPMGEWIVRFDSDDPANVEFVGWTLQFLHFMEGLEFTPDARLWAQVSFAPLEGYEPDCSQFPPGECPTHCPDCPTEPGVIGLFEIDPLTGAATEVGESGLGFEHPIHDLSYNPIDEIMYGISQERSESSGLVNPTIARLVTINLSTGAATIERVLTHETGVEMQLTGLAIDGTGNMFVHDLMRDVMMRIEGETLVELEPEGFDAAGDQGMTIDWSRDGTWYHPIRHAFPSQLPELLVVDDSGVATSIGTIGMSMNYKLTDIAILPAPSETCPPDLDHSGGVEFTDLLQLLSAWGECASCAQDLDDSGSVGFNDLLILLSAWGPCA